MSGRAYKVLAADDDPALLAMLADNLSMAGYDVTTAGDGRAAIDTALRERPDLIILDLTLPDMDGMEVIRALRAHVLTREVAIVLLTAVRAPTAVETGFASGADDYITKPFAISHLLARVQTWLLRREDRQARA